MFAQFVSYLSKWRDRKIAVQRLRRLARPASRPVLSLPDNNQRFIGDRAMIAEAMFRR